VRIAANQPQMSVQSALDPCNLWRAKVRLKLPRAPPLSLKASLRAGWNQESTAHRWRTTHLCTPYSWARTTRHTTKNRNRKGIGVILYLRKPGIHRMADILVTLECLSARSASARSKSFRLCHCIACPSDNGAPGSRTTTHFPRR
jgi:hypothetical protein